MASATLVWFRHDLRLHDRPELLAAAALGPVVPVYVHAPDEDGDWAPGAASRYWLHRALQDVSEQLRARGSRLIVRAGASARELAQVTAETAARRVVWSRSWSPAAAARDEAVAAMLRASGAEVVIEPANLLVPPDGVSTAAGEPYRVFTPFWRRCQEELAIAPPRPAPLRLPPPDRWPRSLELHSLGLEPQPDWAGGIRAAWLCSELGGRAALADFLDTALDGYGADRDRPDRPGTSRLSPYLHFGQLSVREVWHALAGAMGEGPERFRAELGWREFAHHLLHHFPHTVDQPLQPRFAKFPWQPDEALLVAWQRGQTGYPMVDAAMRELWVTGWMHNRARMLVASFLIKHLLQPWQSGARWFWDTLVDADLANNTLGWQWTAGCGADAAPFFRIFNPLAQGPKFDPEGAYVRRWLPALEQLPTRFIHAPWTATEAVLRSARVRLGENYPWPIVDHGQARAAALAAFAATKNGVDRSA